MTVLLVLLFAVSIGCDVAGQMFFKLGALGMPEGGASRSKGFVTAIAASRWLQAGLAVYALETVVWLRILSEVPISIAFPIASLNFLGVALASSWFLGEQLSPRQWAGAGLVTIGVALVAGAA